jgi:hypothetical protein
MRDRPPPRPTARAARPPLVLCVTGRARAIIKMHARVQPYVAVCVLAGESRVADIEYHIFIYATRPSLCPSGLAGFGAPVGSSWTGATGQPNTPRVPPLSPFADSGLLSGVRLADLCHLCVITLVSYYEGFLRLKITFFEAYTIGISFAR